MQQTGIVPIGMCLWPGLSRLWYHGKWFALATAFSFACLLNFALVFSFIWPEAVHPNIVLLVWSGAATFWLIDGWRQYRERESLLVVSTDSITDNDPLLHEAQCEYLAGQLGDAASLVERILVTDPRDVEARLLLATIMRRQDRLEDADEQLIAIKKYDGAVKWTDEINKEGELLDLAFEEAESAEQSSVDVEEKDLNSRLTDDSRSTAIPETGELATMEEETMLLEERMSVSERFALQVSDIEVSTQRSASQRSSSQSKPAA